MLIPERRDLRFKLNPERLMDYLPDGREACHLLNSLSVLFPEGERFFIESVRQHRDEVSDPDLKKAITAFIGQEAMHGREHEELTAMLSQAGMPAKEQDEWVGKLLHWGLKHFPKPWPLAITAALEHFTAMLAVQVLEREEVTSGSEPGFRALWNWHALEETEHKAVAYDVWVTTQGSNPRSYLIRVSAQLLATALLFPIWFRHKAQFVKADPKAGSRVRGFFQAANFLLGRPGLLRVGLPLYLDYFRPGFHPWDHGNPDDFPRQLQKLEAELAPYMADKKPRNASRTAKKSTTPPPVAEEQAAMAGASA